MKIQSSHTKTIYNLEIDTGVKKDYVCPECSGNRKKNAKKDLWYYPDTKLLYCHHCETTFFEYKPYETQKQYVVPEWRNKTDLTDKAVKYFESRMISQRTLIKMKVFSDIEFMPQLDSKVEVICFPYFIDGIQKNIKFRGAKKSFKLISGAELIWYNFDALKENKEIIICEGEMDALTWIENGYDNVVSVPAGANKKLEFLDSSIDLFTQIDKIYLSNDNDSKGIELRDELVRRLSAEKCNIINLKQYKDCNDYFIGEGSDFKDLIKNSKPVPVKGIVKVDDIYNEIIDFYEKGVQPGLKIENENIDQFVTWELGRLAIVTGVPSSGKSEFVDYLIARLNLLYGWKAGYFTPENYPLKFHYRKIHEKYSGQEFSKDRDTTDFFNIYEHVKANYFYILDEDDMKIDSILLSAKGLIRQYGIKVLVIDPYNKLEHQQKNTETETQYISKFLDKLARFAKFNNILIFLIAHPVKMQRGEIPTLYSISGSSHFYNKTDYGFTVHRERDEDNLMKHKIDVIWQKIRFKHLGEQGVSKLKYNYNNGRFEDIESDVTHWDNTNWLVKEEKVPF